ncbi:MAG TPA: alanine--tRNA ligase [Terriglobales bacterium]|nr:alanine--tRNA ligase [Terriglobales bacterium]
MTGSEIREMFLRYFEQQGHRRVHSSSLVPANDPTLLFTNAGMNQFKDVFLGLEKRDYLRATSSQKCVRAGGKHNDLENVGFTNRHHTFFEMLGNFSFGDYFKKDAIRFAWELVTGKDWYNIPKEKLYVTIFKGEQGVPRDEEAYQYWLDQGVTKERIFELGMKDNFWQMGDTGPCGPCSEIHYDMGVAASDQGHTDCKFGCECGRYVEIWNLVFMQFDRDASGKLNPLPKPSIDTGMGLERVASVKQGVISNYDTDLFVPLMKRAAELCGVDLQKELKNESKSSSAASLRVIADHARATTFLISDGVMPANEGRGYVLRKIMRRGIRHGRILGANKPFMYEMVHAVRDLMKDAYPELVEGAERVSKIVYTEETRFAHTIDVGLGELEKLIAETKPRNPQQPVLEGPSAFKLYDTFGLPRDFIEDAARDQGVSFDSEGFDRAMAEQRERARASWKGGAGKATASPAYRELNKTVFEGYRQTESRNCEVLAIVREGQGVKELKAGEHGEIVLDHTPFYADSGGQVGDTGWFYNDEHNTVVAEVQGCYAPVQGVRAHKAIARQLIHAGQKIDAVVNAEVRMETMRNHTATHLLHAALRETLGKHVKQAGSLVDPQHLRFDFSHFTSVADEELQDIEDIVNKEVLKNTKVQTIEDVPIDVAVNEYKAMALFGEKYGERVRVIKIGDFSTELCGGTHTAQTGEIGLIKILNEGSVSSGVRRVEAVTGEGSLHHFRKDHELERVVSNLVSRREAAATPAEALKAGLEKHAAEIKRLQRELDQARMKSAASSVSSAEDNVKVVNGIKVLAQRVDNLERPQMRTLVDNLRNKLGSGVVVLGSTVEVESDGENGAKTKEKKVALIVGVTKDLTGRIQAGKIISPIAQKVGGSGGGRPDMAEAGGKNPAALDAALNESYAVVESLTK